MNRLVTCRHCNAQVNPSARWLYGYYEGTSDEFTALGRIPDGHCPVCRYPLEEKEKNNLEDNYSQVM